MKCTAFALALLLGGAAYAQTGGTDMAGTAPYDGDGVATQPYETDAATAGQSDTAMAAGTDAATADQADTATTLASNMPAASGAVVEPGNANPRRDARGIRVISAAATVPAGWNGVAGTGEAMGGPLLDPATGEPIAEAPAAYPACAATVTDRCLQTYERRRH
jgi:hypothetical protein